MTFQNKRLMGIVAAVTFLLLISFFAMRFTDEVKWSRMDFITAGTLLLGTGLLCELALRSIKNIGYRLAACAALLIALFLIWAELAVGLFGTRFAGS
jgi:hypothetical protein